MNFNALSTPEFASVISDAFFFWLTLTVKATVFTTALLAIVHIRNRWRADLSLTLLWKSGIVTLAALPLLALTPGLRWSFDYLESRLPIIQPVWNVWVNSGLSEENTDSSSSMPNGMENSNLTDSSNAELQSAATTNSASRNVSLDSTWFIGFQFLTIFCWIALALTFACRKCWELSIGTGRWFTSLNCSPAPNDWKQELLAMRNHLKVRRNVDLHTSSQILSPVALGTLNARIILPKAANAWSSEDRQSAIAHELSHIKNRDLEFQWMTTVAQSCFWFLPWAHRLVQWLTLDQERDGDQSALAYGTPKDAYLEFLTNVAARVRSKTNSIAVEEEKLQLSRVGLQMSSGNESSLKRRIYSITRFDSIRSDKRRVWTFISAVSMILAGAGLGSAQLVSSEKELNRSSGISSTETTEKLAVLREIWNPQPENEKVKQPNDGYLSSDNPQAPPPVIDNEAPELILKIFRISGEPSEMQKISETLSILKIHFPSFAHFNDRFGMLHVRGTSEEISNILLELLSHEIKIDPLNEKNSSIPILNWHTRSLEIQNPGTIAAIRANPEAWLDNFISELKNSRPNIHPDTRLFVTKNNPEQILIQTQEKDMDWIIEALTIKDARKAIIHATFTILEMDKSVAKEFVQLWSEGDQIRTGLKYQTRESSGLQEALENSISNNSFDNADEDLNQAAETASTNAVSKSEDQPKLQMIIPDLKYREVMQWAKGQPIEVLSAPQVTTLSGRQAQIAMVQHISVVNGVETLEGKTIYTTQQIPYGLSIDLIPTVDHPETEENRNPSVRLTLLAQFSEFLGYDDPEELSNSKDAENKQDPKPVIPLPRSRKRTLTTDVNVPDGAALLIGSLPTVNKQTMKSKIPMLGDIPHIGKLFRREQSQEVQKLRFIIVQPTIVENLQ